MYSNEVKFKLKMRVSDSFIILRFQLVQHMTSTRFDLKQKVLDLEKYDFYFDEESQTVRGEPEHAEEFEFTFQYSMDNATHSGRCKLNIIPDPRSLWKVLEPEAGQPFIKDHTDQHYIYGKI